jgi:hypothetical protein
MVKWSCPSTTFSFPPFDQASTHQASYYYNKDEMVRQQQQQQRYYNGAVFVLLSLVSFIILIAPSSALPFLRQTQTPAAAAAAAAKTRSSGSLGRNNTDLVDMLVYRNQKNPATLAALADGVVDVLQKIRGGGEIQHVRLRAPLVERFSSISCFGSTIRHY